ncbi:SRPBCC family protein [Paenibacillus glycanilyticus]|uniref:SRPBCC family protein n=1 Tax=Paenibacillus glycanilyticus TaxID=126569 RepID=UPI00203EB0D9|nr:SRPBCC family protein [Paenibacillus glycanilyticus]MCM3627575.1 SRPBCC family protein [Paenibacillus glycanilyticus]
MYTRNEITINCDKNTAFRYARQVEQWPALLPHYRGVQFEQGSSDQGGLVMMRAVRPFKPFKWPVWWVSEMRVDDQQCSVYYKHVRGVTSGMEVEWQIEPHGHERQVKVIIIHRWLQPPFGRRLASDMIGDLFVHAIADRTLQGLKEQIELQDVQKEVG